MQLSEHVSSLELSQLHSGTKTVTKLYSATGLDIVSEKNLIDRGFRSDLHCSQRNSLRAIYLLSLKKYFCGYLNCVIEFPLHFKVNIGL